VVFNNQIRFPPQVVQNRWPDIMGRTTIMATQTSTLNSLRHLYALAEVLRLKYKAHIEVRLMAVHERPRRPRRAHGRRPGELAHRGALVDP
jgi:hypothetical protein